MTLPTAKLGHGAALAVIPARGGSKGVPRKNIRLLAGRPLLEYVLGAALESKLLARVVVSSDDDEILQVARALGGEAVPLRRPPELARDETPDVPMLRHAVEAVEAADGVRFDYVVQLHATTPFLTAGDIDLAMHGLNSDAAADSTVSVCTVQGYHPVKLKRIEGDRLVPYLEGMEELTTSRRQDVEPVYKRNGGLYASRRYVVMELGRVWGDHVRPYVMPEERSLEIDSPTDFLLADLLMRHVRAGGGMG